MQDVGAKGRMGARWLLRGMQRLGKVTSSVVVVFDRIFFGFHFLHISPTPMNRGFRLVEVYPYRLSQ